MTVMVTFRSSAAPDIVMLRDLAQYLPGLVGKGLDEHGVISTDELPGAIAWLEQAVRDDMARERAHERSTQARRTELSPHAGGLAQRAWPLLDMMRAAHEQGRHVMWGVQARDAPAARRRTSAARPTAWRRATPCRRPIFCVWRDYG